jgi:FkbM family methyltransferase
MNPGEQVSELQSTEIRIFQLMSQRIDTRFMIDVGAHHGATLLPFLEAGWDVVAFEPIEANRKQMISRFFGNPRLTIRPEAVSESSGTKSMHLALNLDGSLHDYYHSLEQTRDDRYHRKGKVVPVPVVSLDDLAAKTEIQRKIGFLKVDTEGHDLAVLQGAGAIESAVVGVEFWGDRHPLGKSPSPADKMVELMAQRGYKVYLAVCHVGEKMIVLDSSMANVPANAWGNLFFFHGDCHALYLEMRDTFQAGAMPKLEIQLDPRLQRLLSLSHARKKNLAALMAGVDGEFVAGLQAAYPSANVSHLKDLSPQSESLDELHARGALPAQLDVLRLVPPIDVPGFLRRARNALAATQPVILAHLGLAPGKDGISPLEQTVGALHGTGYCLAGSWNAQTGDAGLVESADMLFMPKATFTRCLAEQGTPYREDSNGLLESARSLQHACDQRMTVIQNLDAEVKKTQKAAADRLELVHAVTARAKQMELIASDRLAMIHELTAKVKLLQRAAGERLEVIQELDDEVNRMHRIAAERMAVIENLDRGIQQMHGIAAERLTVIQMLDGEVKRLGRVLTRPFRRLVGR